MEVYTTVRMQQQLKSDNMVEGQILLKIKMDIPLTKIGNYFRNYGLDKFSQVLNILKVKVNLIKPYLLSIKI